MVENKVLLINNHWLSSGLAAQISKATGVDVMPYPKSFLLHDRIRNVLEKEKKDLNFEVRTIPLSKRLEKSLIDRFFNTKTGKCNISGDREIKFNFIYSTPELDNKIINKIKNQKQESKNNKQTVNTQTNPEYPEYPDKPRIQTVNTQLKPSSKTEKGKLEKDNFKHLKDKFDISLNDPIQVDGNKLTGKNKREKEREKKSEKEKKKLNEFFPDKIITHDQEYFDIFSKNLQKNIEKQDIRDFYSKIEVDLSELKKYCKNDELVYYTWLARFKKKINEKPKYKKGRIYHIFHSLPKEFRENVVKVNGCKLVEVFDIPAADLHMMAKYLEEPKYHIPEGELLEFQKQVKTDFRKKIEVDSETGKCTKRCKEAFKMFFNLQSKKAYLHDHGEIFNDVYRYFREHFPHICNWIIGEKKIWKLGAEAEYEVVSKAMFKKLLKQGIFILTCHDAIYVMDRDVDKVKPIITDLFYECLDLLYDQRNLLFNL